MKSLNNLLLSDARHIWHPYSSIHNETPLHLVESASGATLYLKSGEALLDGMSSWWSTIHGYNHPALNDALHQQAEKMAHVMFGGLTHEPAITLAERLVKITPSGLNRVFFADSGSVAVEVAVKMALQYWRSRGGLDKHRFLSFYHGYHGDTFAAMGLCDPINGMHHLFQDVLVKNLFADAPPVGIDHIPTPAEINAIRSLFEQHHHELAGLIIEPIVQGTGGMRIYSRAYLKLLRELCDEFDVLMIADEIATGFGRTGKLFACEYSDVSPDILCIGKALTGGYLSFAATLCSDSVATEICAGEAGVFMHGPTFMGNPLACAVASANIDLLLNSPWEANIQRIQSALTAGLQECRQSNHVKDVRTLGAIGVIELTKPVNMQKITRQFVDQGIWLRPFGRLVYTMPPYIMTDEELHMLTGAMVKIVGNGEIF